MKQPILNLTRMQRMQREYRYPRKHRLIKTLLFFLLASAFVGCKVPVAAKPSPAQAVQQTEAVTAEHRQMDALLNGLVESQNRTKPDAASRSKR